MKCRKWLLYVVLLSCSSPGIMGQEIKPEDDPSARGFFLVSRPVKSAVSTANSALRKPARPTPKVNNKAASDITTLGLGYTIYLRNQQGQPVRVDPRQEFRAGDAVRITIESNANGHLYIFHSEGEQPPIMLFPDPRLAKGENRVQAHVPYEVPSSKDVIEARRWFVFDERAAMERIYLVFSENPLPEVPQGAALVAFCQTAECPWQPSTTLWESLKQQARQPLRTSISRSLDETQTSQEQEAISRGLSLPKEAPAPSVVKVNQTKTAKLLVTTIDLIHK
jgi:hypothetical protein